MPWPIRYFATRQEVLDRYGFVPVGTMWPQSERWTADWKDHLAPEYFRRHAATRTPLVVEMPCGWAFCVDVRTCDAKGLGPAGWSVNGTPPKITVTPSINIVGAYHGYITDGVITDDCEGRQFPAARGFPD